MARPLPAVTVRGGPPRDGMSRSDALNQSLRNAGQTRVSQRTLFISWHFAGGSVTMLRKRNIPEAATGRRCRTKTMDGAPSLTMTGRRPCVGLAAGSYDPAVKSPSSGMASRANHSI
jgi:hypothetical protein